MPYGTVNADVIGTSVAGSNLGAGNASIMKNRIINGGCVIDQRNSGASVTPTTDGSYTLDRWIARLSQSSKFSVQQNAGSVTPPAGYTNYLGVTSLSAYSVNSTDYFQIGQYLEGFNVADLNWGTSNAKTVTLSAWVYSSLTGTFGGTIFGYQNGYPSYPFSYSIPVANTWTQISITITGPTSGTWNTNNNGSVVVLFSLGVGSSVSGTANTWNYSTLYRSPTGATSVVGTNGATFYITGVQLEVGSSATGFEYRQYGTELALCQRYYQLSAYATGIGASTTIIQAFFSYATQMRVISPTVTQTGVLTFTDGYSINPVQSSASLGLNSSTYNLAYIQLSNFSSLVQGKVYGINSSTNNAIAFSAEL